jgi:RsiW-degrading membrane proteinase PrsW (M82 family)
MPTIPMIVPLLITGILVGHVLRTKKASIGRRLALLGSLLGGVGNVVNGAILYLFQNKTTTRPDMPSFVRQTVSTQTPISFLLLSFIVGTLIVLLVLIPATLIQRRGFPRLPFGRGGEEP